jgi:hypothetical protein
MIFYILFDHFSCSFLVGINGKRSIQRDKDKKMKQKNRNMNKNKDMKKDKDKKWNTKNEL